MNSLVPVNKFCGRGSAAPQFLGREVLGSKMPVVSEKILLRFYRCALGIEVLVYLSLMEMSPFGKGGSDIIWGLPFFGLVVLGLAIPGLTSAIRDRSKSQGDKGLITAGLIMNGLSLAAPILLLILGIGRALLSPHP